jgi:hypothetical protein
MWIAVSAPGLPNRGYSALLRSGSGDDSARTDARVGDRLICRERLAVCAVRPGGDSAGAHAATVSSLLSSQF